MTTLTGVSSQSCTVRPLALADIRGRATITPAEASDLLGMGMQQTYTALKDGSLPSLRLSRRILVPVPALLRLLGEVTDDAD
ncbi:hypothetical protein [Leifsonia sp. P73]|uniref:hypothetical protein n=1 Tax=Leifsonia sp. P73 TaxID=3423959 RepID=UPI003DA5F3F1